MKPHMHKHLIFSGTSLVPKGKCVNETVSLVDLYPTILELCGISPEKNSPETDGASLVKLIGSQDSDWKGEALFEYYADGIIHPMAGLRKGRYKYVYVHNECPILYDLEADPNELSNLAGQDEYQIIRKSMEEAVLNGWDAAKTERKILQSQRMRKTVYRAQQSGGGVSWDYYPVFDASKQYVR